MARENSVTQRLLILPISKESVAIRCTRDLTAYIPVSYTHLDVYKRQELGLTLPLTMYVARHSWASIARDEGIPISVISEGMGHDSESTTQIYLCLLYTSRCV